jgi:hypothetical protein
MVKGTGEDEEEKSSIRLVVVGRGGGALSGERATDNDGAPSDEGELTHKTVLYRNNWEKGDQ